MELFDVNIHQVDIFTPKVKQVLFNGNVSVNVQTLGLIFILIKVGIKPTYFNRRPIIAANLFLAIILITEIKDTLN